MTIIEYTNSFLHNGFRGSVGHAARVNRRPTKQKAVLKTKSKVKIRIPLRGDLILTLLLADMCVGCLHELHLVP